MGFDTHYESANLILQWKWLFSLRWVTPENYSLLHLPRRLLLDLSYLKLQMWHCIVFCVSGLLQCLLQQQAVSSSSVKLCSLLLSRRPVLIHDFISLVRQSKNLRQNAAIVLPLLSAAFKSSTPIEQNILNKMYSEYSAEIQVALLSPSEAADWLKSYSSIVVQLMHKCIGKLYINETLLVQAAYYLNYIYSCIYKRRKSLHIFVIYAELQKKLTHYCTSCEVLLCVAYNMFFSTSPAM